MPLRFSKHRLLPSMVPGSLGPQVERKGVPAEPAPRPTPTLPLSSRGCVTHGRHLDTAVHVAVTQTYPGPSPWPLRGGRGSVRSPPSPAPLSTVLAYMQLLEDYSEPQPSMFYQMPQKEHVYQQKNKLLMEVYGFNDSFSASDAPHELAPPPALPPKQRQLVSGGTPHQRPRMLGLLSCSHLALQEWLLLQSRPLQLGLACTQNVCFLCGQSFFSVSFLWLQSRPP